MFTLAQYTEITGKKTLPQGTVIRNIALPEALEYRVEQHNPKTGKFLLYSQLYKHYEVSNDTFGVLYHGVNAARYRRNFFNLRATKRYTGNINPQHWEILELPAMPVPVPNLRVLALVLVCDAKTLKTLALTNKKQPEIDGLIIECDGDSVTLTRVVKDETSPLVVSMPARVETAFKALIFAPNAFIEWLCTYQNGSNGWGESLAIRLDQNKRIEFKTLTSVTRFTLGDLNAYCEAHSAVLSELDKPDYFIELPYADFKTAWEWIGKHTAKDDNRPVLTGILARVRFTLDDSLPRFSLTGADGYRLAIKEFSSGLVWCLPPDETDEFSLLLPRTNKGLDALWGYKQNKNDVYTVRLYINSRSHTFGVFELRHNGTPVYSVKLDVLEGKFPDYESIVPAKSRGQTRVLNDDLQRALIGVLPYLESKNANVGLECNTDGALLSEIRIKVSSMERGDIETFVTSCGHDGTPITITVNARSVLDALQLAGVAKKQKPVTLVKDTRKKKATQSISEDFVTLTWQTATDPLVIKLDDDALVVIMPVRPSPDVNNLPSKVQSVTPAPVPSSIPAPAYVSPFVRKSAPMPAIFQLRGAMGCDGFKIWRMEDNDLMPLGIMENTEQAIDRLRKYLGDMAVFTLLDEDGAILYPVSEDAPTQEAANEWDNGIVSTPYSEMDIVIEIKREREPYSPTGYKFVALRDGYPCYLARNSLGELIEVIRHDYKGAKSLQITQDETLLFSTPTCAPVRINTLVLEVRHFHRANFTLHPYYPEAKSWSIDNYATGEDLAEAIQQARLKAPLSPIRVYNTALEVIYEDMTLKPDPDPCPGLIFKPYDVLALDTNTSPQGIIYAPRDVSDYEQSHKLPRPHLPRPVAVQIASVLIASSLLFGKVS